MKAVLAALGLVMLAGCGSSGTDPSGAGTSETGQLNDAAAMLEDNSVSADAITTNRTEDTK